MTERQARAAANALMAAAALGAAVFVLRSPKLRRMAWQMARQYAGGPLAVWAAGSVRDAWNASASTSTSTYAGPRTSRATVDRSAAGLLPERATADQAR
jgi:hypothetical protein